MTRNSRTGNATIILLIVALVVGVVSTILIITITRTSPKTQSSAAAPVTTTLLPAVPKSSDSGQAKFAAPTTTAAPTTVTTSTTTLAAGEVSTSTMLSTDRTQLAVDFIAASFTGINNITYTITYTADVSGLATTKNIQGTFAIASTLVTGYKTNGYPYIRKTFTLGTCSSGGTCVYDSNPRTFQVSITAN